MDITNGYGAPLSNISIPSKEVWGRMVKRLNDEAALWLSASVEGCNNEAPFVTRSRIRVARLARCCSRIAFVHGI
jgi:hypothetical protein